MQPDIPYVVRRFDLWADDRVASRVTVWGPGPKAKAERVMRKLRALDYKNYEPYGHPYIYSAQYENWELWLTRPLHSALSSH